MSIKNSLSLVQKLAGVHPSPNKSLRRREKRTTFLGDGSGVAPLNSAPGPLLRVRANMAHIRQSRPDYGLGFLVQAQKTVLVVCGD